MSDNYSHCNENPQFSLPLDQWALWRWWSIESLSSGCCPFNLNHIGIVSLVEVRIRLHKRLPDLAATNSAILESSSCCRISCGGLKLHYELIGIGSISQNLVICYQGSAKTGWTMRRTRNKAGNCEEHAEKVMASMLLKFGILRLQSKLRIMSLFITSICNELTLMA